MTKCPYEILGVEKSSTDDEIDRAYRRMAKQHHPDSNGTGDTTQFKMIVFAYEILKDCERRRLYDEFGETEPRKNATAEMLASILNGVLQEIIESGRDFEKVDVVKQMTDEIKRAIKNLKERSAKAEKKAEKFRSAADRMIVDDGDNILRSALLEPAKQMEAEMAAMNRQVEQLEECEKMLSRYRYKFDKANGFDSTWPPSVNSGGWASYTFGTKG